MHRQLFGYSLNRDLGCPFIWEPENAGRNTAECNCSDPILQTHIQRIPVAGRKLIFQLLCQSISDNRTNDMNHLFRREVIGIRQHGNGRRLFIIPPVPDTERFHLPVAFLSKLNARKGMDAVCYTQINLNVVE